MSATRSTEFYAPYCVVACLNSIILRQQLEATALRHENAELQKRVRDDQGVRQFARSQLEEYQDFLRGPMQEDEVKFEIQRLGEFEDDECDDEDEKEEATMATAATATTMSEEIV
jgi:hypothetical protein